MKLSKKTLSFALASLLIVGNNNQALCNNDAIQPALHFLGITTIGACITCAAELTQLGHDIPKHFLEKENSKWTNAKIESFIGTVIAPLGSTGVTLLLAYHAMLAPELATYAITTALATTAIMTLPRTALHFWLSNKKKKPVSDYNN